MHPLLIAGLVLLGLVLLFFAFAGFGHITRGTPISHVRSLDDSPPPVVSSTAFCELIQVAMGAAMRPGNQIEVLANGDAIYPRLWRDLREARETITLQLYFCRPGRMADELKTILMERARAGVKVLFLRDAFGTAELTKEYTRELTDSGVEVCDFRPTHWYELHKAQNRSHIRVVVVDGRIAYTGGFGIDDQWYGDGHTNDSWRETCVRFTGPAVAQHQAIFVAGWAEAANDLLVGSLLFPEIDRPPSDGVVAASVHCAPTIGSTASERLCALSIVCAERTLYIANAYFVPDDDFRRLLVGTARRGVDVRILTVGPKTDTKVTWHATHARYTELLEGGVRIFEYQPSMMHAKVTVVDGVWSIVGTLNFDNRSFALNDESVVTCYDRGIAATLDGLFLDDLGWSKEILIDEWRKRPLRNRIYERSATLMSRLL
jgi:cardiolipin synthase